GTPAKPWRPSGILRQAPSTTVLENCVTAGSPVDGHRHGRAGAGAGRGPAARTVWRSRLAHGVQAGPGAPRGRKSLGSAGAWRKARGSGGEGLARSAARKAYAAIHNAPW